MVSKWDIFFLDLDPTKGSEQRGVRPVLVVSNDAVNSSLPVFTCVPFSSVKPGMKVYPTEIFLTKEQSGLPCDSVLMLQQIRTVSHTRITGTKVSTITDPAVKARINRALIDYFELD